MRSQILDLAQLQREKKTLLFFKYRLAIKGSAARYVRNTAAVPIHAARWQARIHAQRLMSRARM
jgi:hypothetical protein